MAKKSKTTFQKMEKEKARQQKGSAAEAEGKRGSTYPG